MKTGTKSLLFGAHQFIVHPLFVAVAWAKLYSFPADVRLWVAFVVHDWGYWGLDKMQDALGERHPIRGALLMSRLFDTPGQIGDMHFGYWGQLSLLHSRYYAKAVGLSVSPLAAADKLATALVPLWLYRLQVLATGEWREYVDFSRRDGFIGPDDGFIQWSGKLQQHFRNEAYRIKAELETTA